MMFNPGDRVLFGGMWATVVDDPNRDPDWLGTPIILDGDAQREIKYVAGVLLKTRSEVDANFEAEAKALDGVVSVSLQFDDTAMSFGATPRKIFELADMLNRVAAQADAQMPPIAIQTEKLPELLREFNTPGYKIETVTMEYCPDTEGYCVNCGERMRSHDVRETYLCKEPRDRA